VAAAAHELGTPLATIKLVSSELAEELADQPELLEDAT
jgi:two-component system, sensor histidine kinase RegB